MVKKKEIQELKGIKNLEIKTRTSVAAYHQYNYLLARENLTDHLEAKDKTNKIRQRLPKTRSGKILRGTIRKIADNVEYKMPPTIDDPAILDEIKDDLIKNDILKK